MLNTPRIAHIHIQTPSSHYLALIYVRMYSHNAPTNTIMASLPTLYLELFQDWPVAEISGRKQRRWILLPQGYTKRATCQTHRNKRQREWTLRDTNNPTSTDFFAGPKLILCFCYLIPLPTRIVERLATVPWVDLDRQRHKLDLEAHSILLMYLPGYRALIQFER